MDLFQKQEMHLKRLPRCKVILLEFGKDIKMTSSPAPQYLIQAWTSVFLSLDLDSCFWFKVFLQESQLFNIN